MPAFVGFSSQVIAVRIAATAIEPEKLLWLSGFRIDARTVQSHPFCTARALYARII
jgi:hypothetical protein